MTNPHVHDVQKVEITFKSIDDTKGPIYKGTTVNHGTLYFFQNEDFIASKPYPVAIFSFRFPTEFSKMSTEILPFASNITIKAQANGRTCTPDFVALDGDEVASNAIKLIQYKYKGNKYIPFIGILDEPPSDACKVEGFPTKKDDVFGFFHKVHKSYGNYAKLLNEKKLKRETGFGFATDPRCEKVKDGFDIIILTERSDPKPS